MDFFTHMVVGALLYIFFLKDVSLEYLFIVVFFSVLPDLDIFITPLKRVFKSNYFDYRAGSHSYIVGIIVALIIGEIYLVLAQKSFLITWVIGSTFYGVHVSMDLLTTTKIPCFYPLSKKEYCFYVEKAGSSFTLFSSWIFLLLLFLIGHNLADFSLLLTVINFFTYFFLIYYIFRIGSKLWINAHLTENQKYFPGVLPFYYYIYEHEVNQDGISLQLVKKSHFKTRKTIYKNHTSLTAEEKALFQNAMALIKQNYYFAKWNVLPIFLRKEGVFSARFYFIEPMVHARAMYIQYDFDVGSQSFVKEHQSFGRLPKK